ncbi:hypothetical protein [Pseudochryseolinea flava]|uniref:Secretion system C-terminal sorting domain-containing protein n=1 Tax=Pseudochryseolinea flava TaxID=2059302 RepID=A0A364XZ63_9BACT|nr:hypothetical protein [Pseudochryseolinea flava]RAV99773.1 hypothetical protein DQQ10_17155 [Pseudochryseolinea flava]
MKTAQMMKPAGLTLSIMIILMLSSLNLVAQTYTTNAAGPWATGATWGGTAPSDWQGYSAIINHNVTVPSSINGFNQIRINSGRSFTSGSAGTPQNLSMQNVTNFNVNNGNVTVYGDLTLNATTMTITTGSLTVTGTLTLTGDAVLTNNGTGLISVGAFNTSGSGGTLNINAGSLSVTNAMSINSSSNVTVAAGRAVTVGSLAISNNNDAVLDNSGNFTVTGSVSQGGTLNNLSGGTLQINGNLTGSGSGSSVTTNSGTINVSGNASMPSSSRMQINPGGTTSVNGNFTVGDNENLVVGTNVAPPAYADLIIRGNLNQTGSGDVRIRRNGRFAVFGNVTDSGGGDSRLTVESGGQAYVHGNISYTGGGSQITNGNAGSAVTPYGLYVNGTTSNTGGGSTTTANKGNLVVLQTTNVPFYNWVNSIPNTPMPVSLIYFKVTSYEQEIVSLAWATATEKNTERFSIERSVNGSDFVEIGSVPAHGNSTEKHTYGFQDSNLVSGRIYYRLTSIDYDGYTESFKVVFVDATFGNRVELYPNSSTGAYLNIKATFEYTSDARFEIYDSRGFVIEKGSITTDLNLTFSRPLVPGSYLFHYVSSAHKQIIRFVVK